MHRWRRLKKYFVIVVFCSFLFIGGCTEPSKNTAREETGINFSGDMQESVVSEQEIRLDLIKYEGLLSHEKLCSINKNSTCAVVGYYTKNKKMTGMWTSYYENGNIFIQGHYRDGVKNGFWKESHPSGILALETQYKDGKEMGDIKVWYANGRLKKEGTMKNGKETGLWKYYYEDGQLMRTGGFKNGLQDGSWKSWYENGQLEMEKQFQNGNVVAVLQLYSRDGNTIEILD